MKLHPLRFNRHLANIGQQVLWRKSYACSCVNANSGSPDPKHSVCSGKGRIWDAPIQTLVGVPNQSTSARILASLGTWEQGDMVISIPSDSPMWDGAGRFDRVTALNATDVFSVPLVRGHVTERLLFTVASITRVFWFNPVGGALVDGGIPTVANDGTIVFSAGEPPSGMSYSMTGTRLNDFYLFDQYPSDRNEHSGAKLPKKVQLRAFDLFGR